MLKQWEVKRAFAVNGALQADSLLRQAAGAADDHPAKLAVWNTTSWERSEVVLVSKELSRAGDYAEDEQGQSVPTQRLASGELALLVEKIPAFSKRTFQLSEKQSAPPAHPVAVRGETLANHHLSVTVDAKTGDVVRLMQQGDSANLIDAEKGAANRFLYLNGTDLEHLGRSGIPS